MIAERKAAGQLSPASHPLTRPAGLEAEAVSRLLRIAQAADCPVVIVHLTNREALREVEHARRRGQKVYVETCPQYLLLDEHVYFDPDYSSAARYVCAPAPAGQGGAGPFVEGTAPGRDPDHLHRPLLLHPGPEGHGPGRILPRSPADCPAWRPGRADLFLRRGQAADLRRPDVPLPEWTPARLYGLFPRKGILRPSSDADIVVSDPTLSHDPGAGLFANVDYNPYEGFATVGGIRQVWLRGQLSVSERQGAGGKHRRAAIWPGAKNSL